MEIDAVAAGATPAGHRHIDARSPGLPDGPEGGGALVADHSPVAAREHRGPEPPARPEVPVAQGVDAAVPGVEPPRLAPVLDRASRQPDAEQLRVRDDAALGGRDPGREHGWSIWGRIIRLKIDHAPSVPARLLRRWQLCDVSVSETQQRLSASPLPPPPAARAPRGAPSPRGGAAPSSSGRRG